MIYFDNAATSMPKPPEVAEVVAGALAECGNPARGAHEASLAALRMLMLTRERLSAFFNVGDPARVVFTANATHSLNLAIASLRGHVVATAVDHNSVLRPLYRRGNHTIVPVDEKGRLNIGAIEQALQSQTEAVVMTHASNVTGNVYDLRAVADLCRRRGVRLIVDAAQTAGLLPIDMTELGLSALCCSGHKSLYGPQGTGVLCLGPNFLPEPLIVGGSGSDSFSPRHPESLPDRLEAGTHNMPGIAGLNAGVAYVMEMKGHCFREADRLTRLFIRRVRDMDPYILYGDVEAELRIPVVALNHRKLDAAELAYRLHERHRMAVRAGAHCAPLMHRALGTGENGAVRFSFSHFNRESEVADAVAALEAIAKEAG